MLKWVKSSSRVVNTTLDWLVTKSHFTTESFLVFSTFFFIFSLCCLSSFPFFSFFWSHEDNYWTPEFEMLTWVKSSSRVVNTTLDWLVTKSRFTTESFLVFFSSFSFFSLCGLILKLSVHFPFDLTANDATILSVNRCEDSRIVECTKLF